MIKSNYVFLVLPFLFISCVNQQNIDFNEPKLQIPKKVPIVKRHKGSLFSTKGPSLFADKKDLQIGDIIQVKISESLSSNTNNNRETSAKRKNSLGGGIVTAGSGGFGSKVVKAINPFTNIGFGSATTSINNGKVKSKLNETFSTNVSATIQETYQNGNYLIKGFKEMLIDGQKQSLLLSGVIRPYDITSDNSVFSSQIANLKILYQKDGEEQDVLHIPWGLSIIQKFWPF